MRPSGDPQFDMPGLEDFNCLGVRVYISFIYRRCCIPVEQFLNICPRTINLLVTRCTNKFNIQQLYVLPTLYLCVV
jgi:hypothetical protein